MLGDEVAQLWQVKHWMRSISFVINQHPATTAGTNWRRIVRRHTEAGIVRMGLAPLTLVAGLGTALFTESRTRPGSCNE
ncbi:hypothetical protein D3C76_1371560 [compost metagenome]